MVEAVVWPSKMTKVVNLSLDDKNIRLEVQHLSQDAIIQDLFQNEGAFYIVESILQNGFFNAELPVVTREGKNWVVLEGNRRVAALKSIINPKVVPSYEKRIVKLLATAGVPDIEEIEVKVSPSREEAQRFISSIHTTQARKPWRPLRQAYFYHAQIEGRDKSIEDLIQEYPGVNIPKFVKMWEMHRIITSIEYQDAETQRNVNSRSFKITTLERLYDNDKFRAQFGLRFDSSGRVSIVADKGEFEEAIAPVIRDIAHGRVDSRKINTESQLLEHLQKWKAPRKDALGSESKSEDFTPIPVPARRAPSKHLIPKDISCSLNQVGVQKRLDELQNLPYERYPMAALDSLRSLLECALKAYCAQVGIVLTPRRQGGYVFLEDALIAVETHLTQGNIRKDLVNPIKRIRDRQEVFSLKEEMDSINHNPHMFSDPREVKSAWDRVDGLMRFLLNPI